MAVQTGHSFHSKATHDAPLIVHVVYSFDVGGLENGIVNLVNRMSPGSWRHAILALTDVSKSFARRIEREDVRLIELHKRPGHLVRHYPQLYRIFKELKPAIVHTRNLAALEACVPAWAAGVPVRIHGEHGWDVTDPDGRVAKYRLIRRIYRPFVDRYVALSRHLSDYLVRSVGIDEDVVSRIYNGVDTRKFHSDAQGSRRVEGCPFTDPNHWVVGTVGRFEAVKDQMNLLCAFARTLELVPKARDRLRLMMVGNGSFDARLREEVSRRGIADLVWMPGPRSDIPAILRSMDCFVLPSLSEGISNTILEAMACALPVIATRVGGNSELIEDGMNGLLAPPANSDALAQAILRYFHDGALARRHARAGRRMVEERFSLDRMVADYVNLYEGLTCPSQGRADRLRSASVDDSGLRN